ncbi:uncharacterized protein SCODWIG_01373 [Saccharomycodes ludwigii]|uniref:Uncharacterized protein n=1 Tax=Saccharomycodes ludwigii TaxID=36035 RepID=A0A376B4R3_9ASCO|nr:hypothetical protein SCDLUD_004852 [Saccharomycodes ludwigii]KAH3899409.1 hypothetical protein SCDLUD_004852 [Saccharomycodes ludwigii]SSD59612.1 uncharacterized protein SCODWIG_01373 [Saccharomycodes ludwigii]
MGFLGRHSKQKSTSSKKSNGEGEGQLPNVKITRDDVNHLKVRTASVHDPILSAVQEEQPFEQAAEAERDPNRKSFFSMSQEEGAQLTDVFGQPILNPDISNPTRARDERPLDTIKSFEYSISGGDPYWAQNLETAQYGFRVRPDFPSFHSMNPYTMNTDIDNGNNMGELPPAPVMMGEQGVYTPAPFNPVTEGKKKKKRGLFGKKKNKKAKAVAVNED